MSNAAYNNPYGCWTVTTEADCEGKSSKNLGTFIGYVDDIAFSLADKCFYSLEFKPYCLKDKDYVPKSKRVHINFGIDSKTWDMPKEERVEFFKKVFKDRDVQVKEGSYYATVELVKTTSDPRDLLRKSALAKLTNEEKEALGL